ncbi:MAG: hypothetical protein M1419_04800 [Bacteroidetes bacterium]|nr:hypothetical protein [Bacteroidota bacterium]
MNEIVFSSKLIDEGSLYCPKEYSYKEADYKVIVTLPESDNNSLDIESSAAIDNSEDYLSNEEINYYLTLD